MALLPPSFLPETYESYGQLITISPVKVTAGEFQGAFGSPASRRDITWVSLLSTGVLARRNGGSVLTGATGAWAYG
jgi:hypothetical protein